MPLKADQTSANSQQTQAKFDLRVVDRSGEPMNLWTKTKQFPDEPNWANL